MLKKIRTAKIYAWLNGGYSQAGLLNRYNGMYLFEYGSEWLNAAGAFPIDPVSLPLEMKPFQSPTNFGGILDACPDSWGRHVLDIAAEDEGIGLSEFDYMLWAGEDRIGALAFSDATAMGPYENKPVWTQNLPGAELDLSELWEAANMVDRAEELHSRFRRFFCRGSSLGGARPKASVEIDGVKWIAKFGNEREVWPTCRIEDATHRLASLCGIHVAKTDRLTLFGNRDIFLSKRFDRTPSDIIPFASGKTLMANDKDSYMQLAKSIRSEDREELFKRMAFNAICGNFDDHSRNHAVIFINGEWRLSPAYDVVPQPMVEDDVRKLAMRCGKFGKSVSKENILSCSEEFGLDKESAENIFDKIRVCFMANWEEMFEKAGIEKRHFKSIKNSFMPEESKGHGDSDGDEEQSYLNDFQKLK